MTLRDQCAIHIAPLFLRLALAVTFIWAGWGKLATEFPVQGDQAALLANMGVTDLQSRVNAPAPSSPLAPTPTPTPISNPTPSPTTTPTPPASPSSPAPATPLPDPSPSSAPPASPVGPALMQTAPITVSTRVYTASDFPEPVPVMRLYGLALMTHSAAYPAPRADGTPGIPLAPEWAAKDAAPLYAAWAVTLIELVGGTLILLGMFTRLNALLLAGVMFSAMWLTQMGPAIQSGSTTLGFLPAHGAFDIPAWMPLLWQFALCFMSLALFFAGSGTMAIDNALAGRPVYRKQPAPKPPAD